MKLLSIVFSFKNEEKNLQELIERVANSLSEFTSWEYEMIFVNDCSTDKSEDILLKLQKKYPIRIVNMSRNFGVGPCVLAGFKLAKGDAIVYIDSDLQDPPEIIKELVKEHENGAEVVHTIRTKRLGESRVKMFLTLVAYKIINFFSDIPLHVNAGDFKLISRKALDKILELNEFRPYIRGLSVWVGYKQSKVYYVREPRSSGESNFSLFGSGPVNEFLTGITAYSLKPLYISIILGFFAMLVSLILILHTIYAKLNNLTALGSASILITISFFSGMILLSQGITAIYIARIFEQVRGRKRYVIKDIKEYNLK